MTKTDGWRAASYALVLAIAITALLNMMRMRAGFLTNHLADLTVPAWLYIACRGLYPPTSHKRPATFIQRMIGRTPETAALSLFAASTITEASQRFWPHGIFPGTFDRMDVLAYGVGLGLCYAADKIALRKTG